MQRPQASRSAATPAAAACQTGGSAAAASAASRNSTAVSTRWCRASFSPRVDTSTSSMRCSARSLPAAARCPYFCFWRERVWETPWGAGPWANLVLVTATAFEVGLLPRSSLTTRLWNCWGNWSLVRNMAVWVVVCVFVCTTSVSYVEWNQGICLFRLFCCRLLIYLQHGRWWKCTRSGYCRRNLCSWRSQTKRRMARMLLLPCKTPQCKQMVNMYGIPVSYFVCCNMGLFTSLCRGITVWGVRGIEVKKCF